MFFATSNLHKVEEVKRIINIDISYYKKTDIIPYIIEDGKTFESNALIKARENYKHLQQPVLCEDSGLSVLALNNSPGIYSARYAGANSSDDKNRKKLLEEMIEIEDRKAYYTSFFVYYYMENNKEVIITSSGELWGEIALKESGNAGFGYDPIFIPEGYNKTLSELGNDIKDNISHRKKALISFKKKLNL